MDEEVLSVCNVPDASNEFQQILELVHHQVRILLENADNLVGKYPAKKRINVTEGTQSKWHLWRLAVQEKDGVGLLSCVLFPIKNVQSPSASLCVATTTPQT